MKIKISHHEFLSGKIYMTGKLMAHDGYLHKSFIFVKRSQTHNTYNADGFDASVMIDEGDSLLKFVP